MDTSFVTNISGCIDSAIDLMHGHLSLVYYSHIPVAAIALLIGMFVFMKNRKELSAKTMFVLSIVFTLWVLSNLVAWISSNSASVSFTWSMFGILNISLFYACFYLVYVYKSDRDIPLTLKTLIGLSFLPILIMTPTHLNIGDFNHTYCYPVDNAFLNYPLYLQLLITLGIVAVAIKRYLTIVDIKKRHEIILISAGAALFLLSIFGTGYVADKLQRYDIEVYGVFAMPLFLGFLAYLIVKYKAFNVKLIGAQALVWALVILIGSQFFFIQNSINKILTAITLVISAIVGLMIVRGVKKEIAQKEHIEKLAESLEMSNVNLEKVNISLETANDKLKELDQMKSEFVSLATHQIRGPLAAIKGYISLMIEGDYGKVPKAFDEPLTTVFKSTDSLSRMVTDFLDVSRIDLGQMKYDFTEFDFRDLVAEVVNELKPNVVAGGLELKTKISEVPVMICADRTKLKQVLNNLVDNSAKYTKHGWLEVSTEKKDNHVLFAVKDSGIGISQKTMQVLFQRFSRAKDANETNILGSGLGLYIAKKMVETHRGRIWAESEGEGHGSQFYVELPVIK